jgi:curved DNA-binding protein CbpA
MKNYYDLLGIPPTASQADIKQAYRRLSVKFHPDKNEGDTYFSEMFKQINEAQEILLDETKRQAYNAKLNGAAQQESRLAAEQAKLRREREELHRKQREQELAAQRLKVQAEALKKSPPAKPAAVAPKPASVNPPRRKESLPAMARRWKRYRIYGCIINLGLVLFLFFGPKKLHYFRPAGTDAYVTAEKGLFLREKPQSSAKVLASLPVNAYLKVISTDGPIEVLGFHKAAWYQVKYGSQQGWAWSGYLVRIK